MQGSRRDGRRNWTKRRNEDKKKKAGRVKEGEKGEESPRRSWN